MTEPVFDAAMIDALLDDFVRGIRATGSYRSAEADLFLDAGRRALSGGKRLRAQFVFAAWLAVSRPEQVVPQTVWDAAASVEVFQAAALVHDDLIDNSDLRRGAPAAHRAFEQSHEAQRWTGDPAAFGRSAAVLLGDLLVAWSDDLFERGLAACADQAIRGTARGVYARMRRDVTVGQFMDLSGEAAWAQYSDAEQAARALTIAEMKSARYSVADPLELGAVLGGAAAQQRASLESFGRPLGIAFQMRDDLLGVFGDEEQTGKPSGDDVREGKRTALIAWAREEMNTQQRDELDALLGKRDLTARELDHARSLIRATSAPSRTEALIDSNATDAQRALDTGDFSVAGRAQLQQLLTASVNRSR